MPALPILWIEVRAHCHATEDEGRVGQALAFVAAGGSLARSTVEGHFGNPIVRLVRRLEHRRELEDTWSRWSAGGVPASLAADLPRRLDADGVLHFRLDKQAAYQGSFAPSLDADALDVGVRLVAHPAKPEAFLRVARSLLEGAR